MLRGRKLMVAVTLDAKRETVVAGRDKLLMMGGRLLMQRKIYAGDKYEIFDTKRETIVDCS